MHDIWFWQTSVSPHMTALATALAQNGCSLTYIAGHYISKERANLGWVTPSIINVNVKIADTENTVVQLLANANRDTLHICQGFRSNGMVGRAQRILKSQGMKYWVIMETVKGSGWSGCLRSLIYRWSILRNKAHVYGVLAIGAGTSEWLVDRGFPAVKVFPFAYFLQSRDNSKIPNILPARPYRILFVGQFIKRKRLGFLIDVLEKIQTKEFELIVVGSGQMEDMLHRSAILALKGRVRWLGRKSSDEVMHVMEQADCLILPSAHDGWGAVVSEAMMAGTPAICSDSCGSAGVVRLSGEGGVFVSGDSEALKNLLEEVMQKGLVDGPRRARLAKWSEAISAEAGARYLLEIIEHVTRSTSRPNPPWMGST